MYTLTELDALSNDEHYDMANSGKEYELEVSPEQRALMVEARDGWIATAEEDIRDVFEPVEEYTNWGLYSELRINNVEFERLPTITLSH